VPTQSIPQQLSALLNSIKSKVKDGLTIPEAYSLVQEMIDTGMGIVALMKEPGEEKKAMLLSYLSDLIDYLVTFIVAAIVVKMPFFSRIVASYVVPYIVPPLKQAILKYADAWLEKNYLAKFAKRLTIPLI
jgi:hypothetical protein